MRLIIEGFPDEVYRRVELKAKQNHQTVEEYIIAMLDFYAFTVFKRGKNERGNFERMGKKLG